MRNTDLLRVPAGDGGVGKSCITMALLKREFSDEVRFAPSRSSRRRLIVLEHAVRPYSRGRLLDADGGGWGDLRYRAG